MPLPVQPAPCGRRLRLPLLFAVALLCGASPSLHAQPRTVASAASPGKVLQVSLQLDDGKPSYRIERLGSSDPSRICGQRTSP